MKCPAEIYSTSNRPYDGLPDIAYPLHDRDVLVTACGRICMHRKKINISTVLAGQRVGIKEVDDGIWICSFMRYDLGYIDLEQRTLQSHTYGVVDTGGLSKVVPMGNSRHRTSCDSKAVYMSMLSIGLALAIRAVLVLLFLPFSALDKVLDFRSAVAQAREEVPNKAAATALIMVGLFVEV